MTYHREWACCAEGCMALICLTPEQEEKLRRTHEWFYCPNGHRQHFAGKSKEQKRIEELERNVEQWRDNYRWACEQLDIHRRKTRTCALCGITLRSRGSLERHLRAPVADGGHGAADVELETAEAVAAAHRRGWPEEVRA